MELQTIPKDLSPKQKKVHNLWASLILNLGPYVSASEYSQVSAALSFLAAFHTFFQPSELDLGLGVCIKI